MYMFQASNLSCYDKSQQAQGKLPVCQYWHEEDIIEDMLDIDYYNQNYLLQLMNGIDFLLRLYSKSENKETSVLFTFDKVRKLYQLNQLVGGGQDYSQEIDRSTDSQIVLQFGNKVLISGVITIGVVNAGVANNNNPITLPVNIDTTSASIVCTPSNTTEAFDRLIADYGNVQTNSFDICVRNISDTVNADNVVVSYIVIATVAN